MRVRTVISRLLWVVLVGFLVYSAIVAGTSYFETRQLVDLAVFEVGRRPRAAAVATQAPLAALEEFAVDTREAILVGARQGNIPIDVSKLTVRPDGSGIRVSLHWSYVLISAADETVLAIPLWLDRTFDLKP